MFEVIEAYKTQIIGIIHIHRDRVIEWQDEGSLCFPHFLYPLVFVAASFNDILYAEFIANLVSPQVVPFVIRIEDLRQALVIQPALQGKINAF